jgi:predicted ATPase
MAHVGLASMYTLRRSTAETLHHATIALDLAQEHGFVQWSAWASMMRDWAICLQHPSIELVAAMRKGLDAWEHTGARVWTTRMRAVLAEGYAAIGRPPAALALIDEALHIAHETGEQMYLAELHRLRGELLLSAGSDAEEAESCFRRALDVTQQQQAKSLELRAATSLCRLGLAPGQVAEARRRLADVHGWFTEGFDTPDYQAAKTLLRQVAHQG